MACVRRIQTAVVILGVLCGLAGTPARADFSKALSFCSPARLREKLLAAFEPTRRKLAEKLNGSVLFGNPFEGNLHDLVTREVFRDEKLHRQGTLSRSSWWTDSTVPGAKSGSPHTKELVAKYGAANVERQMYWPNQIVTQPSLHFDPSVANYRVAVTRARINGVWEDQFMEVIGRDAKTGRYEPFFYLKQNGHWISQENTEGKPTRQFCLSCHAQLGNPQEFSPLPNKINSAQQLTDRGYDSRVAQKMIAEFGKYAAPDPAVTNRAIASRRQALHANGQREEYTASVDRLGQLVPSGHFQTADYQTSTGQLHLGKASHFIETTGELRQSLQHVIDLGAAPPELTSRLRAQVATLGSILEKAKYAKRQADVRAFAEQARRLAEMSAELARLRADLASAAGL